MHSKDLLISDRDRIYIEVALKFIATDMEIDFFFTLGIPDALGGNGFPVDRSSCILVSYHNKNEIPANYIFPRKWFSVLSFIEDKISHSAFFIFYNLGNDIPVVAGLISIFPSSKFALLSYGKNASFERVSNLLKYSALYFCSFELVSKRVGNYFKRVGTGTKTRPEW